MRDSPRRSSTSWWRTWSTQLTSFPGYGTVLKVESKHTSTTFSCTLLIGGPTDDDQFLTFRRDLVFYGLHHMARGLAIQYGDGLANNAFWLSDMYWYNLLGKVNKTHTTWNTQDKHRHNCLTCSGSIASKPSRSGLVSLVSTARQLLQHPPTMALLMTKAVETRISLEISR